MFIEDFRKLFKQEDLDNTVAIVKDFNIYKIVETDKPNHIHIYSNPRLGFSGLEVFVNCGEKPSVINIPSGFSKIAYSDYEFLCDTLPFDITMKGYKMWYDIILSMNWVVSFSIATFNLLYALYNLNNCTVEGELGKDVGPVLEYVNNVANKAKKMGRNFFEAINNLRIVTTLI
jgi:hypothetical protein